VRKLALFPVLLAVGCMIAGLYGALHNQISFSVSPDYFFTFKFHQFGIPENLRNRVGASIVGFFASWWMGLIIGIPILLIGLILPDRKTYLTHTLVAFMVVAFTALAIGLGALLYGHFKIPEAFDRAGNMHNFSYLGGGIGIITGSAYLIMVRRRITRHST
jgi:hypothetical protein